MIYDVIGDIHGRADKLIGLLNELGYQRKPFLGDAVLGDTYFAPPTGHRALFIGDLIDRGQQELKTLQIVFAMIDAGVADAIMGNHEYNALAYATPNKLKTNGADASNNDVTYLRTHNPTHARQHEAFLDEVPFGSVAHQYWLQRFYQLPLWLETEQACFVHACWDVDKMALLQPHLNADNTLTEHGLQLTGQKGSLEYDALERVLKGVEVALPEGMTFTDKDGTVRRNMRVKWWLADSNNLSADERPFEGQRIIDITRAPRDDMAQIPATALATNIDFSLKTDKPIFIGHYWLRGDPKPLSKQVVCTDYSAATTGYLTAYRFDASKPLPLSADNFVQYKVS